MWFKILLSVLVLVNLAGCATTKKESAKVQVQQLQSQVSDLEMQLKQRDEEIQGLEGELSKADSAKVTQSQASVGEAGKASSKQIQTALKNAGFYEGPVDGKIGKNTKKAIRAFQEANGLTADGVVGNKTWSKLKAYLQ
ncbi:MAG: peptidoglycan-binding domain-containing protein [Candidatus Omnitrophica bacterium]|nr:peptidoglycan-binding domain-containing protein [Candidatus Omnitrophota bacterium]